MARLASRDLDDVYSFGFERWGEEQANLYLAAFWAAAEEIGEMPLLARLRHEIQPPVRVRRFQAHLIVYEQDETGVVVLRVAHARSNWVNDVR